jgi:hypothetical protein
MSKIIWKDISSYSQRDTIKIPNNYELVVNNTKIHVHRHIYFPKTWLLSCHELGVSQLDLKTNDISEAKEKAINVLISHLNKYIDLQNALSLLQK